MTLSEVERWDGEIMVHVVEVAPGWVPSDGENYALVEVARSGSAYFAGIVTQTEGLGVIFKTNNDAPDVATAIELAREWAADRGAPVVYIMRGSGPSG